MVIRPLGNKRLRIFIARPSVHHVVVVVIHVVLDVLVSLGRAGEAFGSTTIVALRRDGSLVALLGDVDDFVHLFGFDGVVVRQGLHMVADVLSLLPVGRQRRRRQRVVVVVVVVAPQRLRRRRPSQRLPMVIGLRIEDGVEVRHPGGGMIHGP